MKRKYGSKRRIPRKRRRIRRYRRRRFPLRVLPLGGLPQSLKVRLRYCQPITFQPGTGIVSYEDFRANSMRDPWATLGGHQPDGFDQMMAYYNHFTVVGSKCTMRPLFEFTSSIDPVMYGIGLFPDVAGIQTVAGAKAAGQSIESALIESRLVRGYRQNGIFGGVGRKYNVFQRKFSAKKFFGTTSIINKDPYRGSVASDPSEQAYFCCWSYDSSGGSAQNAQKYLIVVEYIAVLTEPKIIQKS